MLDVKRSRPGVVTEAAKNDVGRSENNPTDLAARARRHDHGVLVVAERADGTVTSQVYENLGAAERKVWRTRARGLSATLTLVRLVPVPFTTFDELGGGERQ